jgi:phage gp36-like protein
MIWLVKEDFKPLIREAILNKIISEDDSLLHQAEAMSIQEVQMYLRQKYDVAAAYSTLGDTRNKVLLMITMDILLYHIHSNLNPSAIPQIRIDRYEEAKRMLEKIAKGEIDIDLPFLTTEEGIKTNFRWGSDARRRY